MGLRAHYVTVIVNLPMTAATTVRPDTPTERQARLQRMIEADYRLIWRLLRRLGVPSDGADDATQQVFLIAAERLDDIREGSERAFCFGTALRLAQSMKRRHAREPASDTGDLNPSPLPNPEELADRKRARELLDQILEDIPADLRTVFILFELEDLTSPEIAELVGVPVGTVASRLRRARDRFQALVAERAPRAGHSGGML
ncbi:MAG TPA: sigma-70 family RNA polymerase sigma factor [Polyangiaceae bacterium]|jgi:RNA polymerase sigma-70 factor (ECF subfamily)|nr:sigma-70 family RNA polymerase sigma factor [Polyangiaceae bacterium]